MLKRCKLQHHKFDLRWNLFNRKSTLAISNEWMRFKFPESFCFQIITNWIFWKVIENLRTCRPTMIDWRKKNFFWGGGGCRVATKNFSGQGGFWNKRTSVNISSKPRERPRKKKFLLLDTPKKAFEMRSLTDWWTQSEHFFQKHHTFFSFQKTAGEPS